MFINSLVALLSLLVVAVSAQLSVNTPKSLKQCQPGTISWKGGKKPYFVSVVKASDPCGDALFEFPETSNTWINFKDTAIAAGTVVRFTVEDANDVEVWTKEVKVGEGDEDCLGAINVASNNSSSSSTSPQSSSTGGDDSTPDVPVNAGGSISAAGPSLHNVHLSALVMAGLTGVAAILL